MKLEPKHIIPYLPYKLKLYAGEYFLKNNLDVILDRCDVTTKIIDATNLEGNWFIDQVKPILRPISDLTKEIEVNGEKFVPYKWLKENYLTYNKYNRNWFKNKTNLANIKILPYDIIEKLFEWHFDIFGLIENRLAIDINTLTSLKT
jgi:hypothetical protein